MTRLVSHLLDNSRLYELEAIVPEDNLEITMLVREEARPIEQLSKGQMATALLPLILRDAEYPLIVDQPEDDLDNAFVSEKLIKQLKALSSAAAYFCHAQREHPGAGRGRMRGRDGDGRPSEGPAMPARLCGCDEGADHQAAGRRKEAFRSRQDKYGDVLR